MAGTSKPKSPALSCRFYRTARGNEPVREWLKSLPAEIRKEIGSDTLQVQWRWPVGKPLVDGLGGGLFEVRTGLDGENYRVLFCLDGSTIQRTPKPDLDLARKRQKELEDNS